MGRAIPYPDHGLPHIAMSLNQAARLLLSVGFLCVIGAFLFAAAQLIIRRSKVPGYSRGKGDPGRRLWAGVKSVAKSPVFDIGLDYGVAMGLAGIALRTAPTDFMAYLVVVLSLHRFWVALAKSHRVAKEFLGRGSPGGPGQD